MEDGEEIYMILHHHILTILKPFVLIILLHIIPPIILWFIFPELKIAWILWLVFGLFKGKFLIIEWYYNSLLITNLNIIDVEWISFFNRSSQRIEYNQIESFSYDIKGVLNTIFNVGDITVNKASGNQVVIKGVWRPKKRIQLLTQFQDEVVKDQLHKDHDSLRDVLTNMLRDHINEHGIVVEEE